MPISPHPIIPVHRPIEHIPLSNSREIHASDKIGLARFPAGFSTPQVRRMIVRFWREFMNSRDKKLPASLFLATVLLICAAVATLSLGTGYSSAQSSAGKPPAPFAHSLPTMDGSHLRAILVEVNYAPGERDKPHSHPCPVIGYVAQGAIRFQVRGGPEIVYKTGESFYEPPNGVHQVSANASDTEPARLIAYFTCDHETPLTVPPM
jgi:quercetin dioxygenase-like cupin family protein